MLRALTCIAAGVLAGCPGDDVEARLRSAEIADRTVLARAVEEDRTEAAIDEAMVLVRDRRPAIAAQALERGAIPAAARCARALEGATTRTERGARVKEEIARGCAHRERALRAWQAALARGLVEDEVLLASVRDLRAAERELEVALANTADLGRPPHAAPRDDRTRPQRTE